MVNLENLKIWNILIFSIFMTCSSISFSSENINSFINAKKFGELGFRGFNLGKSRGHIPPLTFDDYEQLKNYGANLVRLTLLLRKDQDTDSFYLTDNELEYLETAISAGEILDFKVIVAFAAENFNTEGILWNNENLKQSVIDNWLLIAEEKVNNPVLLGYDLLNEPTLEVDSNYLLEDFFNTLVKEIRKIDKNHIIFVEFSPWANTNSFSNSFVIQDPNIVYSLHFYTPHKLTHQGLFNLPLGATYPGEIGGKVYNTESLSLLFDNVRQFQKRHDAVIYVGEFGCIRWAPKGSCERWVTDVLDIIHNEKWPWTFHAYRQWHGWDPEISSRNRNSLARKSDASIILIVSKYLKLEK